MKKFLTVLLVIAVMFTFSFSSAFAAVDDANKVLEQTVRDDVKAAYDYAIAQAKVQMDAALNAVFGSGSTLALSLDVPKAAVAAVYEDEYDAIITEINEQNTTILAAIQAAVIADNGTGDAFSGFFDKSGTGEDGYPALVSTWTDFVAPTVDSYTDLFDDAGTGTKEKEVWSETFDAYKADAIKAIDAIDLTVYSTDAKGQPQSSFDIAQALKAKALNQLTALTVSSTDAADYEAGAVTVTDIYQAPVNQADPKGALYLGGTVDAVDYGTGLAVVPKSSTEPTEAAKLQWAQNKVLSTVAGQINTVKSTFVDYWNDKIVEEGLKTKPIQANIDEAKDMLAKGEKQFAAALEIVTYLVKDCDDYKKLVSNDATFTLSTVTATNWNFADGASTATSLADDRLLVDGKYFAKLYGSYSAPTATYTLEDCEKISEKVISLKADAELAKKTVELDGTTYAEIEAALEDAISDTYYGRSDAAVKTSSAAGILADRKDELIGAALTDVVKVNNKQYYAVEAWAKDLASGSTIYEKDQYDVVRKVMADAKEAIKAAPTVADADAAFLAGIAALDAVPTAGDKALAQAKKEFKDLKDKYEKDIRAYADYKAASYPKNTYDYNADTFKNNLVGSLNDAYDVAELTELYNEAVAEIDGLKTEAQLKETKAAIEAQIAAIPTKPTIADVAAVEAARKALGDHKEYCEFIGNSSEMVYTTTPLINAEKAIKDAEIKAIQDAYAAINKDGKVSLDEKAAVEALRAEFDAYCAKYTPENANNDEVIDEAGTVTEALVSDLEEEINTAEAKAVKEMIAVLDVVNVDAAAVKAAREAYDALDPDYQFDGTFYDKLVALEKILAVDVQALKITASSTAKKGSITVKWTAKGNTSAADGYQIWKSTKKNSGYKKAFTTSKMTYKNTKGLKAGSRYYYKVRAYKVVDGQNVYSDWSNKAYRKAK